MRNLITLLILLSSYQNTRPMKKNIKKLAIYYGDTLIKSGYVTKLVYRSQVEVNRKIL